MPRDAVAGERYPDMSGIERSKTMHAGRRRRAASRSVAARSRDRAVTALGHLYRYARFRGQPPW